MTPWLGRTVVAAVVGIATTAKPGLLDETTSVEPASDPFFLADLRKIRNSEAMLADLSKLYMATEAVEHSLTEAYGKIPQTNTSNDGTSKARRPEPGNFHGVKSHAYYVGAISEAHPSLPPDAVQSIVASEWYHPGLTAKPVWCNGNCSRQFPLAKMLDDNFKAIRHEVLTFWKSPDAAWELQGVGTHTTRFDKLIAGNGTWVDVRLWRGRSFNKKLCTRHFRVICSIIEASPEVWTNPWSHVLLSVLMTDSWVPFHQGHTNGQLTYHLPITLPSTGGSAELALIEQGGLLPEDAAARSGLYEHPEENVYHWKKGKTLVFDDSFSHAVRFRGGGEKKKEIKASHDDSQSGARVVLLARAWHPEMTAVERRALREFVRRGGEEDPEGYEMLPISPSAFSLGVHPLRPTIVF